jgi:hypothetical protein
MKRQTRSSTWSRDHQKDIHEVGSEENRDFVVVVVKLHVTAAATGHGGSSTPTTI